MQVYNMKSLIITIGHCATVGFPSQIPSCMPLQNCIPSHLCLTSTTPSPGIMYCESLY